ncbi:MAG TPA: DUF3037 domain-containing protein [Terriglobales bacterium]|jgi:hypothetical protein
MTELQQVDFFLVRYCGNAAKRESINVGLIAITDTADTYADTRFTQAWSRILCFDPDADIEAIQALEREIRQDLKHPERRVDFLKRARETYSGTLEVDPLQTCWSESPASTLAEVSALYLQSSAASEKRQPTGRQRIVNLMRDELQQSGILGFMLQNVAVAEFTRPGDPLKLDFGYGVGGDLKFLHAVSMTRKIESGIVLAAEFAQVAAGMQAKKKVKAWLTAIVDDDLDRSRRDVGFALEMMQQNGIVVVPVAEMPWIAEGIRLELKA